MDTKKFIKEIVNGSFDSRPLDAEIIDFLEIMNISELSTLKAIRENHKIFQQLSLTSAWLPSPYRQKRLGEADLYNKYLQDLILHTCYCTKYKYLSPNPEWEEDDEFIKITSQSSGLYKCKCNNCSKVFSVKYSVDDMGYDFFKWGEN